MILDKLFFYRILILALTLNLLSLIISAQAETEPTETQVSASIQPTVQSTPQADQALLSAVKNNNNSQACEAPDLPKKYRRSRLLLAEYLQRRGWACLNSGNVERAENDLKSALKYRASESKALYGLAKIYTIKQDLPQAQKFFEEADWFFDPELDNNIQFKIDFAELCLRQGNLAAQETLLREALKMNQNNLTAKLALALNLITTGRSAEAKTYLTMFPEENLDAQLALATALINSPYSEINDSDGQEADLLLNKLEQKGFNPLETTVLRIRGKMRQAKDSEALPLAESAVTTYPTEQRLKDLLTQIKINLEALKNIQEQRDYSATASLR
jgi:tetratricopeptide (TPR) repeat protein